MSSRLDEYEYKGDFDLSWLQPAVTLDKFFACDVRHLMIGRRPAQRAVLEAELAADRAVIEAAMQPRDELQPWVHWLFPKGPSGKRGVAVVRDGQVVKAWCTALML